MKYKNGFSMLDFQKNKKSIIFYFVVVVVMITVVVLALVFRQETTRDGIRVVDKKERTIHIAPELVDCEGMAPQKCMIVDGKFFYSQIAGFTFEEGTEYELRIELVYLNPEDVPADGSSIDYRLIEVISERKVPVEKGE